jgi:hypothetical protein
MAVKPIAKRVYICDDLVFDPVSGKVSLLNVWDAIRVPSEVEFPYVLDRIGVFVWWRDGSGKVSTRVEVVQASSGRVIRKTKNCSVNFEGRSTSIYGRYTIQNCRFPDPGYYHIEVFCENEFVDDQIIRVYAL